MLAVALVLIGVTLRVLPHEANFAPIAAIALFGGVYLKRRDAILLPIIALVLSDFVIGFDSLRSRLLIYGSFILVGLIGFAIRQRKNYRNVILGSLAGSTVFYLVTNFVFFYPPTMYSHDLSGMMASYLNALPFYRNTILGDLFYAGLLFGSYELALTISKQKLRAPKDLVH